MNRAVGLTLAAALVSTCSPLFVTPTASADQNDGKLTVRVVRDVNGNGSYEAALELGVAGIKVRITAPDNQTAEGTTAADGTVAVGTGSLPGGKYRVQATIPDALSYLKPAPAGAGLSSLTEFVDVSAGKTADVTMGVWNPADYCQDNPDLITACQRNGDKPGLDPDARSLVRVPWTARGTANLTTRLEDQKSIGSVFGLAYRKQDKRVFSGALAKRMTSYGPDGPGAVYTTTPDGTTTTFTVVPNPGTAAHDFATNFDGAFFGVPGKQGLGDVELSEDGSELYVVALDEKKLHVYDATAATAAAPKASYDIPDPGCPSVDDWRPGGLGVRDGVLYVGGVCSGESTQKTSDMKVAVHKFTGGSFGASPALTKSLDFVRGTSYYVRPQSAKWFPWTASWPTIHAANDVYDTYPMPWLTNIGVDRDGSLILDFRDRYGDMAGQNLPAPDGSGGSWEGITGGDLNRACLESDGTYSWEGTGTCPNNAPAGEPVEYYPGEKLVYVHTETSQGGLAVVYGEDRLPAIVMDPTAQRTGGIGWFNDVDGSMYTDDHDNAYQIADEPSEGWGKSNGLADLEALCDLAPVQIGNRVWFDADADGVQDGGEPALPGVKASLVPCAGGAPVATKTTDAKGEYYFGTADGVATGACYRVAFDYSGADTSGVPGTPVPSTLSWSSKAAGGDRCADSDVDPATGQAEVTVGGAGSVDHCVDGGLSLPTNKLGDYAWIDADRDGVQDEGSKPVYGMTVRLQGTSYSTTTDPNGKYLFDKLPDGTYTVCFDIETLPADYSGYLPTRQNAGGNDAKDSDADPKTGCVAPVALGPTRREDLTLDAGFRPPNRLGDYAWIDANKNGVQDDDEKPVADVAVKLQGTGTAPTKTDANGKYSFEGLPDGEYTVCFDVANLPAAVKDYQVTKPEQGDDRGKDSNADPGTGCAKSTKLDVDRPEDLTIDLGLISPVNRLGDYVWLDADRDGIQDASEKGVPDITVTLKGADRTTKTGPDGKYLFTDLPDGTYAVCFDVATLPAAVKDATLTKANVGDDAKDSDAAADGCVPEVVLGAGSREDLALDAGLVVPVNSLGDFVWVDANRNGVQDAGETGVEGVPVVLKDSDKKTATKADGTYGFTDLPDGRYQVCFELEPLPAGYAKYAVTRQNAGGDDAKDSDADPKTGCTEVVELGVGRRQDLTLDAGIRPPNELGDFVWLDTNRDGLQSTGEPGASGVTVVLEDRDGEEIGATKTGDDGKYGFTDLPDGTYTACFERASLPSAYTDHQLTEPSAGDGTDDSHADLVTWCAKPVTLDADHPVDLALDAGLVEPRDRLGDFVWLDTNGNGVQDDGEPGVQGVTVTLEGGATTTTDSDGEYLFDDLADGSYRVCFSDLPDGHELTTADAGSDDAKDSDADVSTGCTQAVDLGPSHREDLTLDAGLVVEAASAWLASTGASVGLLLGLGALVLAAGGALLFAGRRKRVE